MTQIHVLNGPNLNLLGVREPEIYGSDTLSDIEAHLKDLAPDGVTIVFKQTNFEGQLVTDIQEARETAAGVIINSAAYTHTSVAMMDALKMLEVPVIELHLSNPHAREAFRHHSFVSPIATGIVAGFGAQGYALALQGMLDLIQD